MEFTKAYFRLDQGLVLQADVQDDPFSRIPWILMSLGGCFFIVVFCSSTFKLGGEFKVKCHCKITSYVMFFNCFV